MPYSEEELWEMPDADLRIEQLRSLQGNAPSGYQTLLQNILEQRLETAEEPVSGQIVPVARAVFRQGPEAVDVVEELKTLEDCARFLHSLSVEDLEAAKVAAEESGNIGRVCLIEAVMEKKARAADLYHGLRALPDLSTSETSGSGFYPPEQG